MALQRALQRLGPRALSGARAFASAPDAAKANLEVSSTVKAVARRPGIPHSPAPQAERAPPPPAAAPPRRCGGSGRARRPRGATHGRPLAAPTSTRSQSCPPTLPWMWQTSPTMAQSSQACSPSPGERAVGWVGGECVCMCWRAKSGLCRPACWPWRCCRRTGCAMRRPRAAGGARACLLCCRPAGHVRRGPCPSCARLQGALRLHVHGAALDHPPVCRLLHSGGVECFLQGECHAALGAVSAALGLSGQAGGRGVCAPQTLPLHADGCACLYLPLLRRPAERPGGGAAGRQRRVRPAHAPRVRRLALQPVCIRCLAWRCACCTSGPATPLPLLPHPSLALLQV